MGLALEGPYEGDVAVMEGGARIYFSEQVARSFAGAELGWEDDGWGGGFTVKHPELGTC